MTISKYLRRVTIFTIAIASFLIFTKNVNASEGTIELKSLTGDNYRCYAASIQMLNLQYNVAITCRNLLYPAGDDIFTYMLWATQVKDGKPLKLGPLGLGRAVFKTSVPFSNLFVTTEQNAKTRNPTGTTVMQGNVEPISFLEQPTPKPQAEPTSTAEETTETPTPTGQSTRDKLIAGLKRAALVSLFALLALIGLIFVLTRKR